MNLLDIVWNQGFGASPSRAFVSRSVLGALTETLSAGYLLELWAIVADALKTMSRNCHVPAIRWCDDIACLVDPF